MSRAPLSIRVRLTLWYSVSLLVLLSCVAASVYVLVRARLERGLAAQLDHDLDTVSTVLAAEPRGVGPRGHLTGDILFMVTERERVVYHSSGWCRARCMPGLNEPPLGETGVWRSTEGTSYRVKVAPLSIRGRVLRATVAEDASLMKDTLGALLNVLLLSIPVAAVLCGMGGYLLARRALAPIGAMAAKARAITADSLSDRLPVVTPEDELGRMAAVFNETLSRLESSFERLRAFTSNVSHELRTPLTAMRSVGEAALRRPLDDGEAHEVIGSMLEEVARLTALVECMLTLARSGGPASAVARTEVDVASLARSAVGLVQVLAEEKGQTVTVEAEEPVVARAHAPTLLQALMNLLDNAIRYTPPGGHITVRAVRAARRSIVVAVEDDGPGIAPEDRTRIFERFHVARDHSGPGRDGCGLGLAIARGAIEAQDGRLEVEPRPGGGSRFSIVLGAPGDRS